MCPTWLVFLSLLGSVSAYRFLFFATCYARSHIQFAGKLVDVLVDSGHTVDLVKLNYNPTVPTNGTTKARRIFEVNPLNGEGSYWMEMAHLDSPFVRNGRKVSVECFNKASAQFCEAALADNDLLKTLRAEKYDAGFTMVYEPCPFGIFHLLDIKPVFGFMATAMPNAVPRAFHLPSPSSYVPNILRNDGEYRMSFYSRLVHSINQINDYYFDIPMNVYVVSQVFKKKFGHDFPQLESLEAEMSMAFLNAEKVTDAARPITHKIQHIGGIQAQTPKPLPKEFEAIYSHSANGVVLFSFGSLFNTSLIPDPIKQAFLKAFAKFPQYTFLWKYDEAETDSEMVKNHTNVILTKWMPQFDLLSDKRTIAFISHLGQNSFLETTNAGTPIIAVPLFVDQLYNSAMALDKGLGVRLDRFNLTEESITEALSEVLFNPKYRANAAKISKMLRSQPFSARDVFVRNVEYVVENPEVGAHFQLPSVEMPFWKEHSLDIVGFVLLCAVFLVASVVFAVWRLSRALLFLPKRKCD